MGDIVTATVLQATPDFTIVKIRDGVEAELPALRPEAQPQRGATGVRWANTIATTSALRCSSSMCATPTRLSRALVAKRPVPLSSFLVLTPTSFVVFRTRSARNL